MDSDDLEPRKVKPKPKDLELLGVEELEEYTGGPETPMPPNMVTD